MDFRGLVSKRMWKIIFFGLKSGQVLKSRAAQPHQELPGVTPPPSPGVVRPVTVTIPRHLSSACTVIISFLTDTYINCR